METWTMTLAIMTNMNSFSKYNKNNADEKKKYHREFNSKEILIQAKNHDAYRRPKNIKPITKLILDSAKILINEVHSKFKK